MHHDLLVADLTAVTPDVASSPCLAVYHVAAVLHVKSTCRPPEPGRRCSQRIRLYVRHSPNGCASPKNKGPKYRFVDHTPQFCFLLPPVAVRSFVFFIYGRLAEGATRQQFREGDSQGNQGMACHRNQGDSGSGRVLVGFRQSHSIAGYTHGAAVATASGWVQCRVQNLVFFSPLFLYKACDA